MSFPSTSNELYSQARQLSRMGRGEEAAVYLSNARRVEQNERDTAEDARSLDNDPCDAHERLAEAQAYAFDR